MGGVVSKFRNIKAKGVSFGLFALVFAISLSAIVPPQTVEAFGGYTWNGRAFSTSTSHSYFENRFHDAFSERWPGQTNHVIQGGIPGWVNTTDIFVDFLWNTYTSPNLSSSDTITRERAKSSRVGVAFTIYTMLGYTGDGANAAGGRYSLTRAHFEDVRSRIKGATVNWNTTVCTDMKSTMSSVNPSTMHYDVQRDRWSYANNKQECGGGIVITDRTGKQYRILHRCANPMGTMEGIAPAQWTATPTTTVTSPVTVDAPGQTLTWQHRVTNTGNVTIDKTITYTAQNSGELGSDNVQNWTATNVPATGTNFVQQDTTALITQDHVGGSLCRRTAVDPSSTSNSGTTYSADACRSIPYKYELSPSITSTPQTIEPGQGVTGIIGAVANSGPTKSYGSDIRYTRIIYKKGQTAPSPTDAGVGGLNSCQYYGMASTQERRDRCTVITSTSGADNIVFMPGTRTVPAVTDTVPNDFDVGDRICYGVSVYGYNAATGSSKSAGRHSTLVCVTVGKKPKVHVVGGDLYAGRGSSTSSQVSTSVSRGPISNAPDVDAPQTAFSGLWVTGVDSSGNKLTNGYDDHWVIDRVYNAGVAASSDLCQWASTGASGTPLVKIPKTSSATGIKPSVVRESGGSAGLYQASQHSITGNNPSGDVVARSGSSIWGKTTPRAAWIGQNAFGQNYSSTSCTDPTFSDTSQFNNANIYVFKLKDGFNIGDNRVKLDTARIVMGGGVDNQVKFFVNGHDLGDWQEPGWLPTSTAMSNTGGPGVFRYGKNELEVHVRSTYSHTGILIDKLEVTAKMSPDVDPPTVYGSWSEYGIAATGIVNRMGSGAAYANGVLDAGMCNLSLLSLSNRNTASVCVAAAIGQYPLPSGGRTVADKYATSATVPLPGSTVTPASLATAPVTSPAIVYRPANASAITLNGGDLAAGKSLVIYAPNNDVIIAGNLTYTNGGLSTTGSVPQLVIIARNITINDNVGQVDAWLVAKTASHGNIYTCNQLRTSLTSDVCASKLTVNGPVISNKLHMLRTAGAGAGSDATASAETFNLRPDAYLWGASQSGNTTRVPTADLIELPPRF